MHSGQPANCKEWHTIVSGDTCSTIASNAGLTLDHFLALNPAVSSDCTSNFQAGYAYCIAVSGCGSITATTTMARPTATHCGQPTDCDRWHTIVSGESCATVAACVTGPSTATTAGCLPSGMALRLRSWPNGIRYWGRTGWRVTPSFEKVIIIVSVFRRCHDEVSVWMLGKRWKTRLSRYPVPSRRCPCPGTPGIQGHGCPEPETPEGTESAAQDPSHRDLSPITSPLQTTKFSQSCSREEWKLEYR